MTQQPFDELLAWFDPEDRDRAAAKYETIRRSLIKIFTWGGCVDAEGMADETFNRVAAKVPQLRPTFEGDPALYCYGVAKRLIKECQRSARAHVSLDEVGDPVAPLPEEEEEADDSLSRESGCLRQCLDNVPPKDRALILAYYMKDKQAKIDHRKELAQKLGILSNALRVKVHRIRATLEDCIERCLDEKAPE